MDSPTKSEKLVQEDSLEIGRDGMPPEIWEDMVKHEKFIYFSLMFLNGSVLWAYYSCLSAQDFYSVEFPDLGLDFSFLTTLCTAWPMVLGQGLQMIFGLDKKFSQRTRVHVGYCIFMVMAILIMVFSAINFSSQKTGGILVLVCFGCIGFGNSLSEATYYTFAALFPIEKFTNGVQIGNTCAGILNITVATLLRLAVGGVNQTSSSTKLSFYLFFSLLVIVLICAILLYRYLVSLPSVKFLMERNENSAKEEHLANQSVGRTLKNLSRIFCIIWMPAIAQFLVFFVSLSPTISRRHGTAPRVSSAATTTAISSVVSCVRSSCIRVVTMGWAFGLSVLRIVFIPLLLMGVAGTSLYAFPFGSMGALAFNIVLNLLIGISTGLLSTVTMGVAPRMLKPEDRESGGAVMVFFLFLGIATGSTFGFLVELGHDGMPEEIWDDMVKNERNIFFSLMFLNGSDFYTVEFADSGLDFSFLTTLCTSWPMVIGQAVQMIWSLDKKLTQEFRVRVGYGIFILMAILIMIFSAINFSNQKTGAILVLIASAASASSTYYTIAALFPVPKFSQAVQIGNGTAGILNISLATLLRLAVGGVHQTSSSTKLAFYLFFGILIVVLIVALFVYRRLTNLPSVKFLLERNAASAKEENLTNQAVSKTLSNLWRIFAIIWMPAVAQFLVFFVSLSVFPGFGCAASRNLAPPYSDVTHTVTRNWYCAPGIVGSYNYGDFFGRILTGAAVYKLLNSEWCFGLSIVRLGFIPLLLMGVAGTSLYAFGHDDMTAIVYNIILNLYRPVERLPDRESGGAVMVLCLFLGIAGGSTLGFFFSDQGWLGL
ncbi:Major facilitator superfamily domain [Phytophthora cactorum]|nr:Major facilitator superfamily domain [Phytophthora cactorum]